MNSLFLTSMIMSFIIIIFMIHRKFKAHKFSSKVYYFLWMIMAIRLILPFDISFKTPVYRVENPVEKYTSIYTNINQDINLNGNIVGANENPLGTNKGISPQKDNNTVIAKNKLTNVLNILNQNLSKIWLAGGTLYIAYNLMIYYIFRSKLNKSLSFIDEKVEAKFNSLKLDMEINRNIDIRESYMIDSPMIVGLIKPILVVPRNIDLQNIEYIFTHELIHLKRRDIVYKAFIFAATAIHWFNPVVHTMSKIAGEDLELSCDEEVVKNMTKEEKIIYGKTLVNAISKSKSPIYTTNFSGGVKMVKKRLDKILDSINKRSSKPLITILIVSILGTSFLIGCDTVKKEENLTDKLYGYKTEYVGDNSKVGNIVSNLKFPKGYKYKSMEIEADEKPYSLILQFEVPKDQDLTIDAFRIQSVIMFSLIDNLDQIVYIPVNSESEGILPVDREYIDDMTISVLGKDTKELGSSKTKFKELVQMYEEYDVEAEALVVPDTIDKTDLKPTKYEIVDNLEGVSMFTKEGSVSPKGLTLRFGNKIQPEIMYGESFILEKKIDGMWYELPVVIDGEYGFKDIGYEITFEGGPDWEVDWEWLYGELQPGEYRIIKEVSNLEDTGEYKTHYLATEFMID